MIGGLEVWFMVGVMLCGILSMGGCLVFSSNTMSNGLVVFILVWGRRSVCDMFDYLYKCAENSIMSMEGTSFDKRLTVS